jgi:hypothetical protein
MKHFKYSLSGLTLYLTLFLFLGLNQVKAATISGTVFTYTATSTPNVFLVTLKVYRNCASSAMCTNCSSGQCFSSVYVTGDAVVCGTYLLGTINFTLASNSPVYDAVQLCSMEKTICSNCGTRTPGSFTPGVEVYTFQSLVDLSTLPTACCMVDIGYSCVCRNTSLINIASPSDNGYYDKITINRCVLPSNNSVVYDGDPNFTFCSGVYQTISNGVIDPDGDSLTFSLGSSLIHSTINANYAIPYSPSVPFPYFGMPLQSPPALAPIGIKVSAHTGAVSVQPVGSFVAELVLETKEWRKVNNTPTLVGISRRDYVIDVKNCPSNPIIPFKKYDENGAYLGTLGNENFDSINVCEGIPFCRTYVAMGDATVADTTNFIWNILSAMPGASITRLYNYATRHVNGPRHDSIKICWTPPIGSAKIRPYLINFEARDNACPIPMIARKSIGIFVNKLPEVSIQKQYLGQFAYRFSYTLAPSSFPVNSPYTRWYIEKTPGSNVFDTLAANTLNNYVFSSLGKFKVMLSVNGYGLCNANIVLDSVNIDFIDLALVMSNNISCKGESTGRIKMQTIGGTMPFQYKLNNGSWQASDDFNNLPAGNYKVYVRDTVNRTDSVVVNLTQPATALTGFVTTINPSCSYEFGSAHITASGGDMPYLYKVDNGMLSSDFSFAGLVAKNYTFYAVDANGCQKLMPANISIPSKMVVTSLVNNIKCYQSNLGSVSLSVSGATPPYLFRIDSGANQSNSVFDSLAKGTYKFYIIDSKSCKDSVSIQMNEPAQLISTMGKTDATCLGALNGAAWVQVSGGTLPFSYVWRNAPTQHNSYANNLGAGMAHVTVRDSNGCVKADSIQIGYVIPYSNSEICAVATDTSTGAHKIAWKKTLNKGIVSYKIYGSNISGGAFGLIATVPFDSIGFYINSNPLHLNKVWYYKIRAVDSCGNVSLGSFEQSNIFLQITGNKLLNWNTTAALTGALNIKVWRSIDNGAFQQIASFSPFNLSYQDNTASGFIRRYYLEVDLLPNCLSQIGGSNLKFLSNILTVNTTGVKETIMPNLFQIYPNPSNGKLQIGSDRNDLEIASIELYNVQGDKVKTITCEAHTRSLSLDLTELANGVYQVIVVTPDNTRHNNKLVLNR